MEKATKHMIIALIIFNVLALTVIHLAHLASISGRVAYLTGERDFYKKSHVEALSEVNDLEIKLDEKTKKLAQCSDVVIRTLASCDWID